MFKFCDLIEEVSEFNTDLKYGLEDIIGVTIEKGLIPTVANLTQTALDKFYIVRPNTFIYNPRTHGVRLGMGFNETDNVYITSWNNVAFKVKDSAKQIVLPKYLWLYFLRPDWDRLSNFLAWGSSTIVFAWKDFLDIEISLPSIEKQREIVAEYNTLATRIETNKKLIATLEQTAQTLYRHTFVDNIDPNNLPQGWRMGTLGEIAEFGNGKLTELYDGEYPVYGGNGIVGFTDDFNAENVIVIGRVGVNCGCLYLEPNKCWINDNAIKGFSKGLPIEFLYWHMKNMGLNAQSEGSSQPLITQGILNSQECLLPSEKCVESFADKLKVLVNELRLKQQENQTLTQMQILLLSKMGA